MKHLLFLNRKQISHHCFHHEIKDCVQVIAGGGPGDSESGVFYRCSKITKNYK